MTGASGGIGVALVKELLNQGARVGVHYNKHKPSIDEMIANMKADPEKNYAS